MKLKELKHNHNLTDFLKILIFSLVMLLPFIATMPTTFYYAFNEHAEAGTNYQITETWEYETNEVNSIDDLVEGNIYKFTSYTMTTHQSNVLLFNVNKVYRYATGNDNETWTTYETTTIKTAIAEGLVNTDRSSFITLPLYVIYNGNINTNDITYTFEASDYLGEKNVNIEEEELNSYNAFQNALQNYIESDLMSWTNQTAIHTGLHTMTTGLGITGTLIPTLLTYWFFIIVIYVIIDIILKAFVFITHIFQRKTE